MLVDQFINHTEADKINNFLILLFMFWIMVLIGHNLLESMLLDLYYAIN